MSSSGRLSVDALKDALEQVDWEKTRQILDAAVDLVADTDVIAEALRRAGDLVVEYPGPAEVKRDALLEKLVEYVAAAHESAELPSAVADAINTIRVAEAGYRKLVGELSMTAASQLAPTVHVSAAIRRAEGEFVHLFSEFEKQLKQRDDGIGLRTRFLDESGSSVDVDSALDTFVAFVSMTVRMEAFRNKWHGAEGIIVVPELPDVTDEAVYQVGSTLALATVWRRWRMTVERARVLGRTLRFLKEEERPEGAPAKLSRFILEEGDDSSDWLHRVALERVTDKMSQNRAEIGAAVNLSKERPMLPGGVRALPPHDWISHEEVHGLWGLNQFLAYEVVDDQERPGGLRLVEWVRGYCALMLLARDAKPADLVRTRAGWQAYLARFGLPAASAEILVARLTFRRSSRDLFDHPFIRLGDGRYRLFSLALRSLNVPVVVLSTLSHLSVQLRRKGTGFEKAVREIFNKAGITSYAIKAKRGEEVYEYDAVVPWGDYLFVIECKNRSLPFGSSVQMRYFDLETQENLRQVQRLMRGLEDYPDILAKNLPEDVVNKKKIPVIVNCFPYSAPGQLDGVYLYDYSALARFFSSGELKVMMVAPGLKVECGTGVRLWAADRPVPEDLIAQMEAPAQFMAVAWSLERDPRGFQLLPDWWVYGVSFMRNEPGTTSLGKFAPRAAGEEQG